MQMKGLQRVSLPVARRVTIQVKTLTNRHFKGIIQGVFRCIGINIIQLICFTGGIVMNKTELITAIAEKSKVTKKDAEAVISAFVDVVGEQLKSGDKIQLIGFGTFEVSERAERKGRNPATKEEITIAASKAPRFKPGKALKDLVNTVEAPKGKGKKKK
jgi:DNA-binding protein HU-beta